MNHRSIRHFVWTVLMTLKLRFCWAFSLQQMLHPPTDFLLNCFQIISIQPIICAALKYNGEWECYRLAIYEKSQDSQSFLHEQIDNRWQLPMYKVNNLALSSCLFRFHLLIKLNYPFSWGDRACRPMIALERGRWKKGSVLQIELLINLITDGEYKFISLLYSRSFDILIISWLTLR